MSPCTLPLPMLIFAEYFCDVGPHFDMSVVLAGIASGLLNDWLICKVWKEYVGNGVARLQSGTLDVKRWVGVTGLLDGCDPVVSRI